MSDHDRVWRNTPDPTSWTADPEAALKRNWVSWDNLEGNTCLLWRACSSPPARSEPNIDWLWRWTKYLQTSDFWSDLRKTCTKNPVSLFNFFSLHIYLFLQCEQGDEWHGVDVKYLGVKSLIALNFTAGVQRRSVVWRREELHLYRNWWRTRWWSTQISPCWFSSLTHTQNEDQMKSAYVTKKKFNECVGSSLHHKYLHVFDGHFYLKLNIMIYRRTFQENV